MLSLGPHTRVFLHLPPTDLRKSFDGLGGLVRSAFGAELVDGGWFLFLNKRRDRIKILYFDRDGEALWYKRLSSGSFESITAAEGQSTIELDAAQLTMLLHGVTIRSAQRRRRFDPARTARKIQVAF